MIRKEAPGTLCGKNLMPFGVDRNMINKYFIKAFIFPEVRPCSFAYVLKIKLKNN